MTRVWHMVVLAAVVEIGSCAFLIPVLISCFTLTFENKTRMTQMKVVQRLESRQPIDQSLTIGRDIESVSTQICHEPWSLI